MDWLRHGDGSVPLIEIFSNGSADMVDYNLSVIFNSHASVQNYLRIQTDALDDQLSSLDNSARTNMEQLVEVAKGMLKEPATTCNLVSGKLEPCKDLGSSEEASVRFAQWLSEERRTRLKQEEVSPRGLMKEDPSPRPLQADSHELSPKV